VRSYPWLFNVRHYAVTAAAVGATYAYRNYNATMLEDTQDAPLPTCARIPLPSPGRTALLLPAATYSLRLYSIPRGGVRLHLLPTASLTLTIMPSCTIVLTRVPAHRTCLLYATFLLRFFVCLRTGTIPRRGRMFLDAPL